MWQTNRGTSQTKRINLKPGKFFSDYVRNGGWEMQCFTNMGKRIKVIRFKYKSLFWVFEGAKHDTYTRIEKKKTSGGPNKCERLYVYSEKLTHFYTM
jgi:hypothetical protein